MALSAQAPPEREAALVEARGELEGLVGLQGVKQEVNRLMSFLTIQLERRKHGLRESSQSLHFVFTGNPGTGKTTVARILGKIFYGFGILKTPKIVECDRAGLVGGFLGQTAIKTAEVIQSALDGILFIDEAYTLAGDAAKFGHGDMYGEEAINTLLKQMEDSRDRLIVIAAGYPAPMTAFLRSNPGLESRFTRFIRFEDYSVPDLCRIFDKFCRDAEYALTPVACAYTFLILSRAYLKRDERFGNARFARNVYEKVVGMQAERLISKGGSIDKSALGSIDAHDILLGFESDFDARPLVSSENKWEAECPECAKSYVAPTKFLGQRVTCGCGRKFIYPWWNLVPESMPGLPTELIFKPRKEDKRGIADSSERLSVKGPPIAQVSLEPSSTRPAPSNEDREVICDWTEYLRLRNDSTSNFWKSVDTRRVAIWKSAAECGNLIAQFMLGNAYLLGVGIALDKAQGLRWIRKAADQGFAAAQASLAVKYSKGLGVPQNDSEAVSWWRKAAEQGDTGSQFLLGAMYQDGCGVDQSDAEAAHWYLMAAEKGDVTAQSCIAGMYLDGRGVCQSDVEAARWYQKSAEQGDDLAQFMIGLMYESGQGVPRSATEAWAWYSKAAEQGLEDARKALDRLKRSSR